MAQLNEADADLSLVTRQSLLTRLRDCQDQEGWHAFFELYWRLVYNVARKAGLGDAEAQDVVQNTFIYLSRRMPTFQYDRQRGSFKSWLRVVTRSRIQVFLRSQKGEIVISEPIPGERGCEDYPDPAGDGLDAVWQSEWEENLVNAAFRRLRSKVSSRQLLIFRLATINELALTEVAKKLAVSLPQVYLARHRVGKLFKVEVQRLRAELEE
jgi:RNA polymerase sigma factor (sigma-70 family)